MRQLQSKKVPGDAHAATPRQQGAGTENNQGPASRVSHLDPERLRLFEQALQAMCPDDQAVLIPRYIYQYTLSEIANAIGDKHERTTLWRIERAIRRTRAALEVQ